LNLNCMMFLDQINYANYWVCILECSKNVSAEIPITLLELTLWGSHALTNSIEFRHAKDVKTLELRVMN
jgi:hypothetical protein